MTFIDRDIGLSTEHLTPRGKKKRRGTREADKDPNRMWAYEQTVANDIVLKVIPKNDFIEGKVEKKKEQEDFTDK